MTHVDFDPSLPELGVLKIIALSQFWAEWVLRIGIASSIVLILMLLLTALRDLVERLTGTTKVGGKNVRNEKKTHTNLERSAVWKRRE